MKMTRSSHTQITIQNTIFYILFIGFIGVLGYLSYQYKFSADWTFNNRNTLTENTQKLLKTLQQPLKFIAFVPDDPVLHQEISNVVNKYKRFKADTYLEFINPDLDPAKAKHAGVNYAGQLAVYLGNKHELIESTDEQTIATTLLRLSRNKQRFVVFLEGHGERSPFDQQSNGFSIITETLEKQGFKIQAHNLIRTQSIPNNTDILVIASPKKDLLDGEIKIIQDYLKKGGKLLWLQDPDATQSLQALADQLGILVYQGTIVDANIELQQMLGIKNAAAVPVIDYGRSPITKNLQIQTLFPFSTMVEEDFDAKIKDAINWKYDTFLSSLPSSWLETGETTQSNITFDPDKGDKQGPIPLGIALRRALDNDNKKTDEQRIIIIGDSDFMANSFIGYGANIDLANSLFNWLSTDDNLIEIKPQTARDIRLNISEPVLILFSIFFLIVLPLGLLLTGFIIWLKRRKA